MKKIILTADFLYNSKNHNNKFICWFFKLFEPIIKDAIGDDVKICTDIIDDKGNVFSREKFYNLADISELSESYNSYDIKTFNTQQLEYLKQFFDKDTMIIGFELYHQMTKLLSSFRSYVIDVGFHSYKLFDDLAFCFSTNNKNIYEQLLKYKIPQERFYYYANYWKIFMEYNRMVNDKDLKNNSVLFVGQTLTDKSVEKGSIFLNVTHFEQKIKELAQNYSKIYYLPHPYLGKKRKVIYDYVKKSPYLELILNHSTYGLLASEKISKVVGISTSVLYEAQYFNKEVEYLYKPLFNIDDTFENHGYISIFEDYWTPKFWADILSPVCKVKNDVISTNYFTSSSNKIRNIRNNYWGYIELDPIKRIPNLEQSIRNVYLKYIAPLF